MIRHSPAADSPGSHEASHSYGATLGLFVATTFTASALLFVIQPMFAKMALPHLGGSPSVWNTCMLFFQAALLLAYLYAHLSIRWLGPRAQAVSQIVLLLLPLTVLPVNVGASSPPQGESPTWWLLRMMSFSVGPPFFVLATMAPLLQRWFTTLPLRSAGDPYFLYSASNIGSMLALLAFPFLLEPVLGVRVQAFGWLGGYLLFVILASACALTVQRSGRELSRASITTAENAGISAGRRCWWVLLSFVPSSLMLGVTTHISTDLAAVPLLWIVPLSLYLATFILAFSSRLPFIYRLVNSALPLLALAAVGSIVVRISSTYLILLHLAALFACAMVCHGRLARDRPLAIHLTEFYLWLSVGGVLGGIFNTLIAPNVFDGVYEYPLALSLACLLRPRLASIKRLEPWGLFAVTFVAPFALYAALWLVGSPPDTSLQNGAVIIVIVLGAFWAFFQRRAPFNGLILGIALLVVGGVGGLPGRVLFADRSFFGVMKVIDGPEAGRHVLQHGTTLHGQQDLRIEGSCQPLSYYHRNGPIGQFFALSGERVRSATVIGLGTGALACYAAPGQRMTFFEIDPMIERIARDPLLFTYLQNSSGELEVVIGDGRKLMNEVTPGSQDLIIVDAFSSDSVPVHLMTREALRTYVSRLRPGGIVALHISNRYLDLKAAMGAIVAAEGLFGMMGRDSAVPSGEENTGRTPSDWVLIAVEQEGLAMMQGQAGWSRLEDRGSASAWTDDYSNIFDALILGFSGR